jgi:hypothetical protein
MAERAPVETLGRCLEVGDDRGRTRTFGVRGGCGGVAILGIVVAVILAIRRRDAFSEERGGLWVFHGDTDTSPHQMPGARFEEGAGRVEGR